MFDEWKNLKQTATDIDIDDDTMWTNIDGDSCR